MHWSSATEAAAASAAVRSRRTASRCWTRRRLQRATLACSLKRAPGMFDVELSEVTPVQGRLVHCFRGQAAAAADRVEGAVRHDHASERALSSSCFLQRHFCFARMKFTRPSWSTSAVSCPSFSLPPSLLPFNFPSFSSRCSLSLVLFPLFCRSLCPLQRRHPPPIRYIFEAPRALGLQARCCCARLRQGQAMIGCAFL
jgi:hypothetical protein